MEEMWAWLVAHETEIRIVSGAAFGLSSLVVAWAAYRLSHYNAYGAKPNVVVTLRGEEWPQDGSEHLVTFTCRIHNRQKYKIEARALRVRMECVDHKELIRHDRRFFDDWVLHDNGEFGLGLDGAMEPGESKDFVGKFPSFICKGFEVPSVRFSYFDPVAGSWHSVRNGWRNRTAWRRYELLWGWRRSLRNGLFEKPVSI